MISLSGNKIVLKAFIKAGIQIRQRSYIFQTSWEKRWIWDGTLNSTVLWWKKYMKIMMSFQEEAIYQLYSQWRPTCTDFFLALPATPDWADCKWYHSVYSGQLSSWEDQRSHTWLLPGPRSHLHRTVFSSYDQEAGSISLFLQWRMVDDG